MPNRAAEFHPLPISIHVGREVIEIRSLSCAVHLLRSLRHDRLGCYAEMLLTQLEEARLPEQQAHAWAAFYTWVMACGLHSESESRPRAA